MSMRDTRIPGMPGVLESTEGFGGLVVDTFSAGRSRHLGGSENPPKA